jgi:hypothetical protein
VRNEGNQPLRLFKADGGCNCRVSVRDNHRCRPW